MPDPEEIVFGTGNEIIEREPTQKKVIARTFEIQSQGEITLKEDDLLRKKQQEHEFIESLRDKGVIDKVQVTKYDKWQADLKWLNNKAKTAAGAILAENKLSPTGRQLDNRKIYDNFVYIVSEIHRAINNHVGRSSGSREEYTIEEVSSAREDFNDIVQEVAKKIKKEYGEK